MQVHPLKFKPIFQRRIWGGRTLGAMFGKALPPGEAIGESWELADLAEGQSVVAEGPVAGKSLGELVREWGADLLGRAELFEGRFPLLIKYLDAKQVLSVQVHPDQAYAAKHGGDVRVKNEAWYIVHAEENGCIYRGLKPGVDRDRFRSAIENGTVETLLKRIPVRQGQCFYLPSGTIHALGAGVVVAEIQTPSDTTFRVFDWNRVDPATGRPRELHIEQALDCISFDAAEEPPQQQRSHVASVWTTVTRLVSCPSFVIEKVRMVQGLDQEMPYAEPVVWMVLEGRGAVRYDSGRRELSFGRGDTVLLPAALRDGRVVTTEDCVWLEITLPAPSEPPERDTSRRTAEISDGGA
jgi:mannose-6-phosphate isomerase